MPESLEILRDGRFKRRLKLPWRKKPGSGQFLTVTLPQPTQTPNEVSGATEISNVSDEDVWKNVFCLPAARIKFQ